MAAIEDVIRAVSVIAQRHGIRVQAEPLLCERAIAYELELMSRTGERHVLRLPIRLVENARDGIEIASCIEQARLLYLMAAAPAGRTVELRAGGRIWPL